MSFKRFKVVGKDMACDVTWRVGGAASLTNVKEILPVKTIKYECIYYYYNNENVGTALKSKNQQAGRLVVHVSWHTYFPFKRRFVAVLRSTRLCRHENN